MTQPAEGAPRGRAPSIAAILARTPPRFGAFRIVAALGEGGFAPVFVAVEEHGGQELRTVALKLFALEEARLPGSHPGGVTRPAQQRIVEEARALCRVEHPGIVRFFQLVEDGPVLGLAMEHVRGISLASILEAKGPLDVETTLAIGAAVAAALAAVHAAGLVHRDIKPDNLIETAGRYKLIDFGIAAEKAPRLRPRPPSDPRLAQQEIVVATESTVINEAPADDPTAPEVAGTMGYIDPVCLSGAAAADASSDLYGLGATLYECLTGRLPASTGAGADTTRLRMPVALGVAAPPPVRTFAPHVPEAVAELVDSLVKPRRADRPQRAEWVACELDRLRRLVKLGAPRALPPAGPFRGLDPFGEGDRDILMGRAADLASAIEVLRLRGVLALVGASGSGKTSFARAAVAPAVADGALGAWPPRWVTIGLSPGADPGASLARALLAAGFAAWPEDVPLVSVLARRVEEADSGIVLVIDALEELVTVATPASRAPLVELLADLAASPRPGLRAVVTLRRDLLDPLLALEPLATALTRGAQIVAPLGAMSLTLALEERLAAYGYRLEDRELQSSLARELASTAESMPLVEFALARLWTERDEARRVLPRAALAKIGGVAGALEQHAESTIVGLVSRHGPTVADVARDVLLALTTAQGTRTRATTDDLRRATTDPRRDAVVGALERARLIVREDRHVTLAHEALLVQWPRLRQWTQAARRDRELAADVELAALRWRAAPGPDGLLRGRRLAEARALRESALSEDARAFLAASRRHDLRYRTSLFVLIGAVLGAAGLFVVVYLREQRAAEAEKQVAREFTETLLQAKNTPETQRAQELQQLVRDKHACERALSVCTGDAGSP